MDLRDQKFGIEIELTGITRNRAAKVVAKHFHTVADYAGGGYDAYHVVDENGRTWKIVSDSSIRPQKKNRETREIMSADRKYQVEFVSPICKYDDIEKIQEMVRGLRGAGGFVNEKCGIHVHVDASNHDVRSLRNIVNIVAAKEDMFYKALDINPIRESYCKKANRYFVDQLNKKKPRTKEELARLWYGGTIRSHSHYDHTRYHALNLHSVFQKGTVEFRMFNSTLHAGQVKTYIQFCLAISAQAINQKKASSVKTVSDNEKYTFRTWLLRLGMNGKEFETARMFLLKNLEGNIAWKDPSQAEAQKQRLRTQRTSEECEPNFEEVSQGEDVNDEVQGNEFTMQM